MNNTKHHLYKVLHLIDLLIWGLKITFHATVLSKGVCSFHTEICIKDEIVCIFIDFCNCRPASKHIYNKPNLESTKYIILNAYNSLRIN